MPMLLAGANRRRQTTLIAITVSMTTLMTMLGHLILMQGATIPPAKAAAQTGLTVDPGQAQADQPLPAGHRYALPVYSIRNTGGQELVVTASVSDRASDTRVTAPSAWFHFEPAEVAIPAGALREVRITVALPTDAPDGLYAAWLRFHGAPAEGRGISTVADVQVPFSFDVGPAENLRGNNVAWLWAAGGLATGSALALAAAALRARRA